MNEEQVFDVETKRVFEAFPRIECCGRSKNVYIDSMGNVAYQNDYGKWVIIGSVVFRIKEFKNLLKDQVEYFKKHDDLTWSQLAQEISQIGFTVGIRRDPPESWVYWENELVAKISLKYTGFDTLSVIGIETFE